MRTMNWWFGSILSLILTLFLAGCSLPGRQEATPTPAPTPIPAIRARTDGSAKASGEIRPGQMAVLGFQAGGRVQQLAVTEGEWVEADAVLVQLDDLMAQAVVTQAQSALLRVQASLTDLQSGPRPQEILVVQAQLEASQARLAQLSADPQPETISAARADLAAAQARYVAVITGPGDVTATALAQVQQAQARLNQILTPATESQLAEAQAQVRGVEAELALLTAGPSQESLAAAMAAVAEAEAVLQRAQAEVTELTLRAPFTGTVTTLKVNGGEMVQPGQAVLTLANLSQLQVETTDLSERDVAGVTVGRAATVYVEALDLEIAGRVLRIAPQPSTIGGDVVYTTVIALEQQPPGLRWGMSVEVEILGK